MAVKHEGKAPGRFWYARQYVKGIVKSFGNARTRGDARGLVKTGGLAATLVGGAAGLGYYFYLIPFVPLAAGAVMVVGLAATAGTLRKIGYLKQTSFMRDYIRNQETRWLQARQRPPFAARFRAGVKRLFGRVMLPVMKISKWGSRLTAGAAGASAALAGLGLTAWNVLPPGLVAAAQTAGASLGLGAALALPAACAALAVLVPLSLLAARACGRMERNLKENYISASAEQKAPAPGFTRNIAADFTPAAAPKPAPKPAVEERLAGIAGLDAETLRRVEETAAADRARRAAARKARGRNGPGT